MTAGITGTYSIPHQLLRPERSSAHLREDDAAPPTLELDEPDVEGDERSVLCIHWVAPAWQLTTTSLDRAHLTFGRSREADVRLEGERISRQHAEIFRRGSLCAIADSGSKNGVYVNGRAVAHSALAPNDVIRLGDAVGVVSMLPRHLLAAASSEAVTNPMEIVGRTGPLSSAEIWRIATSRLPVVIVGETGVGKEHTAALIHRASGRSGPLHAINCAAIPENLAEAELFGYRRGAFTGAETANLGHVRAADAGTLLLDELQDLPLRVQGLLLRVLQEGTLCPVGETRMVSVDVRVIGASQQLPEELVKAGRLREDLAMRLSGFSLRVPPLRARRFDVATLFRLFLEQHAGGPVTVDAACLEALLLHVWPGNVRELELLARRSLVLLGDERHLSAKILPEALRPPRRRISEIRADLPAESRNEHDRRRLRKALRSCGGSVTRAATLAGISRQRAYRLMSGLSVEAFLEQAVEPCSNVCEAEAG
ncbi:MAG: sigma 54-interacting transcriptional regulator [Myxococcota bacterium]